jgi:ABC-type amino acid transport substrate-binding protein
MRIHITRGLQNAMRVEDAPITPRSIHMALPRGQPGGEVLLTEINAAIARLKQNGRYDEIVARHSGALSGLN